MLSAPAMRCRDRAKLRRAAMFTGPCPVRIWDRSSAKVTSRILLRTLDDHGLGCLRRSSEDVVGVVAIDCELSEAFGVSLLVGDVAQAVLQAGHLAEPLHLAGFLEPFPGVDLDLDESWQLGGVGSEHGAADAGVFVLTGCSVGSVAGAQR